MISFTCVGGPVDGKKYTIESQKPAAYPKHSRTPHTPRPRYHTYLINFQTGLAHYEGYDDHTIEP